MIFIRDRTTAAVYIAIHAKDVVMLEGKGDFTKIWMEDNRVAHEIYAPLSSFTEQFPGFIRCHKSYLINPEKIRRLSFVEGFVIMGNLQLRAKVPKTGVYQQALKKLIRE